MLPPHSLSDLADHINRIMGDLPAVLVLDSANREQSTVIHKVVTCRPTDPLRRDPLEPAAKRARKLPSGPRTPRPPPHSIHEFQIYRFNHKSKRGANGTPAIPGMENEEERG